MYATDPTVLFISNRKPFQSKTPRNLCPLVQGTRLSIYMTYRKYGFSLSVRSRNASLERSASLSTLASRPSAVVDAEVGEVASRRRFSRRRTKYSATEDIIVMQ